jgi:AraC-like DNA-binding protein/tetratricopeptide (TPR) repeat protein
MNQLDQEKYIERLNNIVEANFTNTNFGVEDLAKEIGLSHSSLHRRLKTIIGKSVSQFIRETRLKRALVLLQSQKSTVSEVAFEVGFGSTTYFSKCFHDYFGYPPGEVKKRQTILRDQEKDPDDGSHGKPKIKSIVVLPFENYTGDEQNDFILFGLHDALICELGQLGALRVISKTSVFTVLQKGKTIKGIASELDVDSILEASAILIENKLRIQLKLFGIIPDEEMIWSQSFDVDISKILSLFSQIILKIANEIRLSLSDTQRTHITNRRDVNPDSYKAYLRGKYYLNQLTAEGMEKGLQCLLESVRIDPAEPFAYAGLALGYLEIAHGPLNPGDAYTRAESAAIQAMKLDPGLAETQLALAEINVYSSWNYAESEKYFRQAIKLNPYLGAAHYHFAWLLYLLGRNEEAVFHHELAQKFDPFNPMVVGHNSMLLTYLGRYEDAMREAQKSFDIQKDCPDGLYSLVDLYLATGKEKVAIDIAKHFSIADPVWKWVLGYAYAATNHIKEAEQVLDELLSEDITSWSAFGITGVCAHLGKMDEAFRWLAYEPHHAWVPWFSVIPLGKPF